MLTFKKGESIKYIGEESKLIPILKKDGWEEVIKDEAPKSTKKEK